MNAASLSCFVLLAGAMMLSGTASAHLEGSCLLRLADLAESVRQCEVGQIQADDCAEAQEHLSAGRRECLAERYTPGDIEHAADHGAARVKGDPSQSPWQVGVRREAAATQVFEPARANLGRLFGLSLQHYAPMLDDNYDTQACPGRIEGRKGRYRWVGHYTLKKTDLSAGEVAKGPFDWQFAEAMVPGECYSPVQPGQSGPWGSPALVNIPRELLNDLARRTGDGKVFVCRVLNECQRQRDLVMAAYQDYLAAVADHLRLERCDGIVQGNLMPKWVTRKQDGPGCPVAGLSASQADAAERISHLQGVLFGRAASSPGHFHAR